MSVLGKRLQAMLFESGTSASALAKRLGIAPATLRNWINFDCDPKMKHLVLVADYFNCSLEYLAGRSNDYSKTGFKPVPQFSTQLKKVIADSGKTIYAACKQTSFAYQCFSDWFNGQMPRLSSLIKLADFFEVTLDQLVGRE